MDVQAWLDRDPDPETRQELLDLLEAGDDDEVAERFGGRLAFGTAGLRGIIGAGPQRMNRLVVRETTAGLGAYLMQQVAGARDRGVVIAYDGRRKSAVFAKDAAAVLAGQGINVFLFDDMAPTPLCGFVVRKRRTAAGIVITASHNPPCYNGYKVFWGNGSQIVPPHDTGIAEAIVRAARAELPWCEPEIANSVGLITPLGDDTIQDYIAGILSQSIHSGNQGRRDLGIAYTAMHGVGARIAEQVLQRAGFETVRTVAEQREPDGAFPTVEFPNPEEPGAMDMTTALAKEMGAELAAANDPDADRFAVAIRTEAGDYRMLTGDQIGVLLGFDFLERAPANAVVGSTVVSSRLLGVMAEAYGAGYFATLTGLKWIADAAAKREEQGEKFIFGYEESIGYMIGDLVRDKDGIAAIMAFAELTAELAADGKTIWECLEGIYRKHGLYLTRLKTLWLDPQHEGPSAGDLLRATPPTTIAGRAVRRITDLLAGETRHTDGKQVESVELPSSDVLIYTLEDDTRVIVRPSGTEPKLKCYYEIRDRIGDDESFAAADARGNGALDQLVAAHQAELTALSSK